MPPVRPRDADVMLERSHGLIARAIRWWTRSQYNHVGVIFILTPARDQLLRDFGLDLPRTWLNQPCVIEAWLAGVKVHLLEARIAQASQVTLLRPRRLTRRQRQTVVAAALRTVGQPYGLKRLLAFMLDIALARSRARQRWTNRLGLDQLVCSTLVAFAFAVVGVAFNGRRYRSVTPQDIAAQAQRAPQGWRVYLKEG